LITPRRFLPLADELRLSRWRYDDDALYYAMPPDDALPRRATRHAPDKIPRLRRRYVTITLPPAPRCRHAALTPMPLRCATVIYDATLRYAPLATPLLKCYASG